jgi:TPR repeat protein
MPKKLICCASLPDATIMSVPIYDFAKSNQDLADNDLEGYYPCCGKNICRSCVHSLVHMPGNDNKCPFCNYNRLKSDEEKVEEIMKRVEANDADSIWLTAYCYEYGYMGCQQDHAKAKELFTRAADLGCSKANWTLADIYREEGNLKKAKFHLEAAAMTGHEVARCNLGALEYNSGNAVRAVKHWIIAASAGNYGAMHNLRALFDDGAVSRELIDSALAAYNS